MCSFGCGFISEKGKIYGCQRKAFRHSEIREYYIAKGELDKSALHWNLAEFELEKDGKTIFKNMFGLWNKKVKPRDCWTWDLSQEFKEAKFFSITEKHNETVDTYVMKLFGTRSRAEKTFARCYPHGKELFGFFVELESIKFLSGKSEASKKVVALCKDYIKKLKTWGAAGGAVWGAAGDAARGAARDAAGDAAGGAARGAARDAAGDAAGGAARGAAWGAAGDAARDAAGDAAWDAARDAAGDVAWIIGQDELLIKAKPNPFKPSLELMKAGYVIKSVNLDLGTVTLLCEGRKTIEVNTRKK